MKYTFEKWLKYISQKKIVIENGIAKHKQCRTRNPKTSRKSGVYYSSSKNKWFFIMAKSGTRTCSKSYITENEAIEAQSNYFKQSQIKQNG